MQDLSLSKESTEILIHAFVSSKLDHCNSLLFGLPAYQLAKLQVLQNTAARVVSLTRKYDHITPVLESLHWLPVKSRIVFKVSYSWFIKHLMAWRRPILVLYNCKLEFHK